MPPNPESQHFVDNVSNVKQMYQRRWQVIIAVGVVGLAVAVWWSARSRRPAVPATTESASVLPAGEAGRPMPAGGQDLAPTRRAAGATSFVKDRFAEIRQLAQAGDGKAACALMVIGDEGSVFSAPAVAGLGRSRAPGIAGYLKEKLTNPDPQVVAAAARSLAQTGGADAVPAIAAALRQNRTRPDGFEDTVCTACVEALGATGSPLAVPPLAEELQETVGRSLQHEYGSAVVAALRRIGHPSAGPALLSYAEKLRAEREQKRDNPLAYRYFGAKLDEVTGAVESLK
jgi:hypothetical protein